MATKQKNYRNPPLASNGDVSGWFYAEWIDSKGISRKFAGWKTLAKAKRELRKMDVLAFAHIYQNGNNEDEWIYKPLKHLRKNCH